MTTFQIIALIALVVLIVVYFALKRKQ